MPRIRIAEPSGTREVPLATSTLIGRHAVCTWSVEGDRIPLYWLELRWVGSWAWRVLAGEEHTRGPGRLLPGGWRRIRAGDRVVGPGEVTVTFVEGGAPEPFAVDPDTGAVLAGDSLDDRLEWRADGAWPLGAEHDLRRARPLEDGVVFRSGDGLLRFFSGQTASATVRGVLDLASPTCELAVQAVDGTFRLTVHDGAQQHALEAEYVRALVPYVEVRRNDVPRDGWLELDAAHFRWLQLGGNVESGRDRIAQDRSRLTRNLAKGGVASAAELFETRRGPEGWVTRVSLDPQRLHLD